MKKIIFIIGRYYTIFVTLFWAACCNPYICARITSSKDILLGLPVAVAYPFVVIAVIVGVLNLVYYKKELPLADRILTVLVPPALAAEMFHMIEYCYATEIGPDIPIGILCFVCGIIVGICFIVNTIKYHKKKIKLSSFAKQTLSDNV